MFVYGFDKEEANLRRTVNIKVRVEWKADPQLRSATLPQVDASRLAQSNWKWVAFHSKCSGHENHWMGQNLRLTTQI